MLKFKQFIPEGTCLECKRCCRFTEIESIWRPLVLEEEIDDICSDKSNVNISSGCSRLQTRPYKDYHICIFLNCRINRCKIYNKRPLECQIYPFLISKTKQATYLGVDLNCPFIKDKIDSKEFNDYLNYLISAFCLPYTARALWRNRDLFCDYSTMNNYYNLTTLNF